MRSRQNLALIATIIGSGMVILDTTVVNLALPSIKESLNASFADLQWIVDGYTLALASLILLGGSLGDIFGRKKIYVMGLAGFGVTSLLCGLAPNTESLILLRIVQGIFGALLVPGGLAIINTNFPKADRGKAIGTWAAWSAIAATLGPLVGGYLIDAASWRWIFFINVPLAIVTWFLATRYFDETKDDRVRKLDIKGATLAAVALGGITYGLIEGPVDHWGTRSIGALVIGFLAGVYFLWDQSRSKDPMVNLGLFRSRNFSGSNIMTFLMYGALGGFLFSLVIYMQTKIGYSAIVAGVSLLPISALLLLFSRRIGGVAARVGARYFMTVGPLLCGLAMLLLINYQPGDSYWTYLLPRVILFAVGLVIFVAPLTMTVMGSVHERSSGIASAINNAVSRIGGLIVIALLGLLGTEHIFKFSMTLSGVIAILSGVISFILIQNPKRLSRPSK